MDNEKGYQQGDVLLKIRKALPQNLKIIALEKGNALVLAHGEATGHRHAIYEIDKAELYVDENGTLWLKVKEIVDLKHEEHKPQKLAVGIYEVGKVKEVDPFTEEIRSVAD